MVYFATFIPNLTVNGVRKGECIYLLFIYFSFEASTLLMKDDWDVQTHKYIVDDVGKKYETLKSFRLDGVSKVFCNGNRNSEVSGPADFRLTAHLSP